MLEFDAGIQGRSRWFSLVFSIRTSVLLQLCDGLVDKDRAPSNFIAGEAKQAFMSALRTTSNLLGVAQTGITRGESVRRISF